MEAKLSGSFVQFRIQRKNGEELHLQSWTKVLGQIYICGTFSNAPNKQSRANSSTLGQPLPPQPPTYNVGHMCTLFLQSFNIILGGGGGTELKTDNSAFLKLRVKNTEN